MQVLIALGEVVDGASKVGVGGDELADELRVACYLAAGCSSTRCRQTPSTSVAVRLVPRAST